MALTRADLSNQIQKSTSFPGLMVTDNANEAYWLTAPTSGNGDRVPFFDDSGSTYNYLSIGAGLQLTGTVLTASVTGSGYDTIKEEGSTVGTGNNIINFVGSGFTAADAGSSTTTITLDATLNALSQFNSNGILVQTATDTFAARTITGTSGRLTVSNGNGVSGNPTLNVDTAFASTDLADTSNIMLLNNSQTVTGVKTFTPNIILNGTPTLDSHGVNKGYVDGLILDRKGTFVDVATTANISLSGEQTIDGYLTSTSRVLVKDQTAPAENGYYTSAAGAWTRTADMNAAAEVVSSLGFVSNGTQQGQIWYTLSVVTTLGTDPITFLQLATGTVTGTGNTDEITLWSSMTNLTSSSTFKFNSNQLAIGTTSYVSGAVISTKGSSDLGTSYLLAHKNATGNIVVKIDNTGAYKIGASNQLTLDYSSLIFTDGDYLINSTNGELQLQSTESVLVESTGTLITTPSLRVAATRSSASNNQFNITTQGLFNPVGAGTNTYTELLVSPTINQTTHTGISYSARILPTLTSVGSGGHVGLSITAASQTALHTTAGKVKFDIGSDAAFDILYRASGGELARLGMGTTGQVLLANTTAAPTWGAVPTVVSEAYLENSTSSTVDLDSGTAVKDVDGTNISFTIPSDLKKFHIYRGGIHQSMTGTLTTRDYTANTTTHVVTFTTALTSDEIVKFVKFA